MHDKLLEIFEEERSQEHKQLILWFVDQILEALREEFLKDKNGKDAAIDAIIKILESHKKNSLQ